jgi:hypothetical protein
MESEFYDIAYVGNAKAFITFWDEEQAEKTVEVPTTMMDRIYEFNAHQARERINFLKGITNEIDDTVATEG